MTAPTFRLYDHRQTGSYWTKEERNKGVYIAKQAIKAGRDPEQAVRRYMGMDEANAEMCARCAASQIRNEYRRPAAAGQRAFSNDR